MVYTSPAGRWFTLRPPADGLHFARRPMVYTSPEIQLLLTKRERWIFYNPGVISDPNPRVGTSIFLVWWSEPTLAIWSERLAKGPYQKNTPPAVVLEPAILRLQIQAFYQLSYPGPLPGYLLFGLLLIHINDGLNTPDSFWDGTNPTRKPKLRPPSHWDISCQAFEAAGPERAPRAKEIEVVLWEQVWNVPSTLKMHLPVFEKSSQFLIGDV